MFKKIPDQHINTLTGTFLKTQTWPKPIVGRDGSGLLGWGWGWGQSGGVGSSGQGRQFQKTPRPGLQPRRPSQLTGHLLQYSKTTTSHTGLKPGGRNNVLREPHGTEVPQGATWPAVPAPESDQRPGDHGPVWTSLCRCKGSRGLEGCPTPAVANTHKWTTIRRGRCTELLGVTRRACSRISGMAAPAGAGTWDGPPSGAQPSSPAGAVSQPPAASFAAPTEKEEYMRGKKEKGRANTPFQGAIGMPTAQPALSAQFRQGQQDQCQRHGHCEARALNPRGRGAAWTTQLEAGSSAHMPHSPSRGS